MDWKNLESAFFEESERAILRWMTRNSQHHAYAFAFHESYRELDGPMELPFLGVNSIESLEREQETEEVELGWNPADWRWENILAVRSIHKLEKAVFEEANGSTRNHWHRVEKRLIAMVVRVAKALRKRFAKHPNTTADFVVYFDDEEGGLALVRKCVPAKLFEKHFSEFEDTSLERLSEKEKLQKYLSEPWMFEKEILALGEAAVEPLLKMLNESEHSWCAPSLFDGLGIREPRIRDALRQRVKSAKPAGTAELSAKILRYWDDSEFLFKLVGSKKTQRAAVIGILAGLSVGASDRDESIPLDYRSAERLLEMKSAPIRNLVRSELEPGSSSIEIKPADVDEALRGLESRYAVIRQHAVCVLGERGLGKAAAKRVLPALAERLNDRAANVRRLALLSLSYWKAAAKPYHKAMRKLQKDKDFEVRRFARYVFE